MDKAMVPRENPELDFSSPDVVKAVREMIQAKAVRNFPRNFQRLLEIAESEDERTALMAIKMLGELAGIIRNKSQVEVRFSFDNFIEEESDHPLRDLFKVGRGPIIDAEVDEEDASR